MSKYHVICRVPGRTGADLDRHIPLPIDDAGEEAYRGQPTEFASREVAQNIADGLAASESPESDYYYYVEAVPED